MPKTVMPLRDAKLSAAKPKDKDYSLPDGGGLVLLGGVAILMAK